MRFYSLLLLAALLAGFSASAAAQSGAPALADAFSDRDSAEASPAPPGIGGLMGLRQTEEEAEGNIIQQEGDKAADNAVGIRIDALKEAGLSFGARGGLAFRTFEIQRRLAEQDSYLSQIFDFNRLLIPASSGLLIEPPIINEATQALIIKTGGQEAAVADRVLKINRAARIVSASRNWRTYLERDWGKVEPPPPLLRPKDDREAAIWQTSVKKGWDAGIEQADDIFQADLDRLTNDFTGMVRYRELVAQRMITPPYSAGDNRGVTGNASELRIGDRGLEITGPSQFVVKPNNWSPATR